LTDLDVVGVSRALARLGERDARPISVVGTTRSTNDDARAAAAAGAPDGAVFLADEQTAGRGRGTHRWHSPPSENVYLSIVLRPCLPARRIAPVSLAIGVAVARALESFLPDTALGPRRPPVGLKWPNDVLVGGRKLAGILVEGQLRGDAVTSLVAGVGVNVRGCSFPPELEGRATSLRLLGSEELDRSVVAARLVVEVTAAVRVFERDGLDAIAAELARRDALVGEEIEVDDLRGVASGIDEEGRLLVRDRAGCTHAVVAGEVRSRRSSMPDVRRE